MKDNLIDEEKAKEEEAAQETIEQKLERLGRQRNQMNQKVFQIPSAEFNLDNMLTRFSRLLAEYSSFQMKVKQRMTKLEKDPPRIT